MIALSFSPSIYAKKQHAHSHGSLDMDIALEGNELLIIMNSPAQSILGFEKKVETEKEKKIVFNIQNTWQKEFTKFISFPGIEKCEGKNITWELKGSGGKHMEVKSELTISCTEPIKGALKVEPKKYSEHIEELKYDYLGPNGKSKRGKSHHGKAFSIDL